MLTSPLNNLIVKVEQKFQDKVGDIFTDVTFHPEEHVTLIGKVISLPRSIMKRRDYNGYTTEGISVGDYILMRYDVVFNYLNQPEHDTPIYRHMLFFRGVEYFKCDIIKVFGVIRKDGVDMINGYVMLEPDIEPPQRIVIPKHMRHAQATETATITNIGRPLEHLKSINAKVGDKVCFNPKMAQRYRLDRTNFIILKQSQVLGVIQEENILAVIP